jgi:predicted transcriptional regulator
LETKVITIEKALRTSSKRLPIKKKRRMIRLNEIGNIVINDMRQLVNAIVTFYEHDQQYGNEKLSVNPKDTHEMHLKKEEALYDRMCVLNNVEQTDGQ